MALMASKELQVSGKIVNTNTALTLACTTNANAHQFPSTTAEHTPYIRATSARVEWSNQLWRNAPSDIIIMSEMRDGREGVY